MGPAGADGAAGAAGAKGDKGDKGDTGATGPAGRDGDGGDGKFVNRINLDANDDDKIKLGYSDNSTGLSLDWLPNPGNTAGNLTLMKVQRVGTEKRLLGSTSADITALINSLSDSANNTLKIRGTLIQSGSINEDRLSSAVQTKLNADNAVPPTQFSISKVFKAGETFYYGTANRVLLFLVRPGQTFHAVTDAPAWSDSTWDDYIQKSSNPNGKIILISDVSNVGHLVSAVNTIDSNNMLTTTINYLDSEDKAQSVVSTPVQLPDS